MDEGARHDGSAASGRSADPGAGTALGRGWRGGAVELPLSNGGQRRRASAHGRQRRPAQGRRSEALQQYQRCERILGEELAVQPLTETVQVVQMILKNDPTSDDEAKI